MLTSDYYAPHNGGGVERVVEEIGVRLARMGHEVSVVTLCSDGCSSRELVDRVHVYRLRAVDCERIVGMPAYFSMGLGLSKLLKNADVVHVHNLFFSLSRLTAVLRTRVPLVTTLHLGDLLHLNGLKGHLARAYESTIGQYILRRSETITAVSNSVAKHASRLVDGQGIRVIPNSVDTLRFRPQNGSQAYADEHRRRVLFLGRLSRNKGPQFLVEAIPRVLAEAPDVEFVFVGEGPLFPWLVRRAKHLGVLEAIRWDRHISDVVPAYHDATMMARPSLTEGMPLTVMEAMACGRPVVASRVAGTCEIIEHGKNGLLVEPGDVEGLTDGMLAVLRDRTLASRMGSQARDWATRHCSWDAVTEMYAGVYEEVAG